jgi:hypothetical protein
VKAGPDLRFEERARFRVAQVADHRGVAAKRPIGIPIGIGWLQSRLGEGRKTLPAPFDSRDQFRFIPLSGESEFPRESNQIGLYPLVRSKLSHTHFRPQTLQSDSLR